MIELIKNRLNLTDNVIEIVVEFLLIQNIRISKTTVESEVLKHPDYPSLLGIADFFENQAIENGTFAVSEEQLTEGFYPCITPITVKDGSTSFSIIKSIENERVVYFDPILHDYKTIRLSEFKEIYQGIIFMIEPVDFTEADFKSNQRKEKRTRGFYLQFLFLIPAIITICFIANYTEIGLKSFLYYCYNLLSYAGLLVCCLLILFEIDSYNPIFKKVCGVRNTRSNCGEVLNSKGATILGLKFSNIGFCYFAALLLVSLLGNHYLTTRYLPLLSLSISPFIFYSVYYQWKVVKYWCKLCLAVQAVLFAQATVFFVIDEKLAFAFTNPIFNLLFSFALTWVFVFFVVKALVPVIQASNNSKGQKFELQKVKYANGVFQTFLEKQTQIIIDGSNSLKFEKNTDATTTITMVCNPFCPHCADAHKYVDKLYQQGKVNMNLILMSSLDNNDIRYLPVKHLLTIAVTQSEAVFFEAMNYWYTEGWKNFKLFDEKYPINDQQILAVRERIATMGEWCDANQIYFTPTILVDGYYLPDNYPVEELKFALY